MTKLLRRFRPFLALPVALMAALLLSGQASAFIYTHQTGLVGPWSWDDNSTTPGVVCNYGPTPDNNAYYMKNLVVQPPTVKAADRNSGKVDTRKVSWRFQLQRKLLPAGTWKVVAASALQTATAKDNAAAPFTALKLKHKVSVTSSTDEIVRIQVLITWYKPSGGVEGTILFRPSYYQIKTPDFTVTSGEPYCQERQTNG